MGLKMSAMIENASKIVAKVGKISNDLTNEIAPTVSKRRTQIRLR